MWPRQSLVAISDARSDLTTVAGFGRDSNPQPSDSETNPLSPRPRPSQIACFACVILGETLLKENKDMKLLHVKESEQLREAIERGTANTAAEYEKLVSTCYLL